MQLGPDCKIYTINQSAQIGVINNPNQAGLACNFQPNILTLVSGEESVYMTNFVSSFFEFPCNEVEIELTPIHASCEDDGAVNLTILQGNPVSYTWSNGDTTQNISNLGRGWYKVLIYNGSCYNPITDSVFIEQPTTPFIADTTITHPSNCGLSDGAINLTIDADVPLSTIHSEGFETDGNGTRYTANEMSGITFFTRGEDADFYFLNPPMANEEGSYYWAGRRNNDESVTLNPVAINGYTDLQICFLAGVGEEGRFGFTTHKLDLEYNIDGAGWNTLISFRQTATGDNLAEDTNGDGIGDGTLLTETFFQDFCAPVPTTGNNIEVRITVNAAGNGAQIVFDNIRILGKQTLTYSYLWNTGDTTKDVSGLTAGNYWVQITTDSGCVVTDTFTLTNTCDPQTLTASFAPSQDTICAGECITFTDNSIGTNITAWDWTFPSGSPTSGTGADPGTVCYSTPGDYNITLQVTDASSNTDDTTITITVLGTTTGSSSTSICQGDSILIGGSYQSTAGTYADTLTGSNGCDSIHSTTLAIDPSEDAGYSYAATTYCLIDPNPTPTITGVTGGTFTIDNGGTINAATGEVDITATGVGSYIITYTTSGTCSSDSSVTFNITSGSDATIDPVAPMCENSPSITLTAADGGGVWSGTGITNASTGTFDPSSSGAGVHEIIYTISGSCGAADTISITVLGTTTGSSSTSICQGDSILIGGSYRSTAGTYADTLTGSNGCDSIHSTTLAIDPTGTSSQSPSICQGASYTLPGGMVVSTAGTYYDTLVGASAGGCDSIITTVLSVTTSTGSTQIPTICQGDTYVLPGGAVVSTANTYYDTLVGASAGGCDSIITTQLTVSPTFTTTQSFNECQGFSVTVGGNTYSATGNYTDVLSSMVNGCDSTVITNLSINLPSSSTQVFNECEGYSVTVGSNTYSSTGSYTDIVNNCDTVITNLTINPAPQINLIKVDDNCGEETGSVTALATSPNLPLTYSWNTGETSSHIGNLPAGVYSVTIVDTLGCSNAEAISVQDFEIDCPFFVYTPNMFSPNGDGQNDVFYVRGKGIASLSVKIYNRWGNKVFEINDVNQGWDGTYKGAVQNTAVFVYVLEATFLNGKTVTESGDVSLIR